MTPPVKGQTRLRCEYCGHTYQLGQGSGCGRRLRTGGGLRHGDRGDIHP
jgi:hypothetical protein